jgi:DNA repair protein RadC
VRRGPTSIDEFVRTILPRAALPSHLTPRDLLDESVVPPAKVADKVLALRALIRTGGRAEELLGTRITSSQCVADHYVPLLRADTMESLHIVGLDVRNGVRIRQCVCRGGIASCAVTPTDVYRPLVLNACSALLLVHNHPSGDPTPSGDDINFTERVRTAGELLGIRLLDHLIIGGEGAFSFADAGLMRFRS